jgi:hypothetical protein
MKNSMSSFGEFALGRSAMKSIGGGCYVNDGAGGRYVSGLKNAKKQAAAAGVNYCCASCGSASWCYDPE